MPITTEQAWEIIKHSKESYVLDPGHSYILNALVEWEAALGGLSGLKSNGDMGMDEFIDLLGKRRNADDAVEKARSELTTAFTMLLSQVKDPIEMVACAFAIEDAVYAVRGFKRRNRGVEVIIPEEQADVTG